MVIVGLRTDLQTRRNPLRLRFLPRWWASVLHPCKVYAALVDWKVGFASIARSVSGHGAERQKSGGGLSRSGAAPVSSGRVSVSTPWFRPQGFFQGLSETAARAK